jgi:hypothetical protein
MAFLSATGSHCVNCVATLQAETAPLARVAVREELEEMLATRQAEGTLAGPEAAEAWQRFSSLTAPLAQDLCEQLRLILEESKAAKLRGDYRTGKRLNMRKIIPYIASEFRKDKIWLRRTKPSKRVRCSLSLSLSLSLYLYCGQLPSLLPPRRPIADPLPPVYAIATLTMNPATNHEPCHRPAATPAGISNHDGD